MGEDAGDRLPKRQAYADEGARDILSLRQVAEVSSIKTDGHKRKVVMAEHQRKCDAGEIYRKHDNFRDYISTERYPRSVLKFKTDKQLSCLHATQKPVALLEYLIRTYTDEGDIVLDLRWAAAVQPWPAGIRDAGSSAWR